MSINKKEQHCPKCDSTNILTDDKQCYSCGHKWSKSGSPVDVFNVIAKIINPSNVPILGKSPINKRLIFKRAWASYKLKLKHNCSADFSHELKRCYKIAKLISYKNYK